MFKWQIWTNHIEHNQTYVIWILLIRKTIYDILDRNDLLIPIQANSYRKFKEEEEEEEEEEDRPLYKGIGLLKKQENHSANKKHQIKKHQINCKCKIENSEKII